jgi:hypothetical protein
MKRLLLVAFLLALFPICAFAQAGKGLILMNESNLTATETGDSKMLETLGSRKFVARVTATEDSGTATEAVTVQHSPDCTTWATLLTFTTLSATGGEDVHVNAMTTTVYPCLRAVATIGGSGQWDIKVVFFAD